MRAHVRRHLDRRLLHALCNSHHWSTHEVVLQYAEGIDWETIRRALRGKVANLSLVERRALEVLVCNGIWWDQRRWLMGYAGRASCHFSRADVGDARHTLHGQCIAMHFDLMCRTAMGEARSPPCQALTAGLRPLGEMGLPPQVIKWRPREEQHVEGDIPIVDVAKLYGDGSGYHQNLLRTSIASWAVISMKEGDAEQPCGEAARATARAEVPGWFRTVPRGEMLAIEHALKRVGVMMTYVGDCRSAIDACRDGVPNLMRSSLNVNADIWTRIGKLMDDKRGHVHFIKTKAHRSRACAERTWDDGVEHWRGNREADHWCKILIRQLAENDPDIKHATNMTATAIDVINYIGFTAGWYFRCAPEYCRRKAPRAHRMKTTAPGNEASAMIETT